MDAVDKGAMRSANVLDGSGRDGRKLSFVKAEVEVS